MIVENDTLFVAGMSKVWKRLWAEKTTYNRVGKKNFMLDVEKRDRLHTAGNEEDNPVGTMRDQD
jgi:hypothetical protein